jgi:hypothetical protein
MKIKQKFELFWCRCNWFLDASQMLYFHIDVWTPDLTAFRVKLVDFWCKWGYHQEAMM